jgi:hypothetical protein
MVEIETHSLSQVLAGGLIRKETSTYARTLLLDRTLDRTTAAAWTLYYCKVWFT